MADSVDPDQMLHSAGSGSIFSWRLIMKYFLLILSLPMIQEGQMSVLAKECTQILVNRLED